MVPHARLDTHRAEGIVVGAAGLRASSCASSAPGYTGEQSDAETKLTYLRARYLDPAVGRFISADTVSPNAPGTQGYNPYAYVANNPVTWVDPSGHATDGSQLARQRALAWAMVSIVPMAGVGYSMAFVDGSRISAGYCTVGVAFLALFALPCAFQTECVFGAISDAALIGNLGSLGGDTSEWTRERLKEAVRNLPYQPWVKSSDPNASSGTQSGSDINAGQFGGDFGGPCMDMPPWGNRSPVETDAENQTLRNIIKELFRSEDQEVGGTAGAIRQETRTGEPVGTKFHAEKGESFGRGLTNLISKGQLSSADLAIAQWLLTDLLNALSGDPCA